MAKPPANIERFLFQVGGLEEQLRVVAFQGKESLSRLYQFDIDLAAEVDDIEFNSVIARSASLILLGQDDPKLINGVVSRFEQVGENNRFTFYRARLVPFFWYFQHRRGSRIFQELSVPEIISKIFAEAQVPGDDYRFDLYEDHAQRDYCVQYRESQLDFISRLLEEEGIYYYFEHTQEGKHVLVMTDSRASHMAIAEPAVLSYRTDTNLLADEEFVQRFSYHEEIRPGAVTLRSFNFQHPNLDLETHSSNAAQGLEQALEVYDHPGDYDHAEQGDFLARVRLQEQRTARTTAQGESDCVRLAPGYLFSLDDHHREAFNRKYLITSVFYSGEQKQVLEEEATVQAANETSTYINRFECMPDDIDYRPSRLTRRPVVEGSQTAIVVGPEGEELYVDQYGRVKVQFHWDREGRRNEKSSCWIRVSQNVAGQGWGAIIIPRIGQEVIVDFLEGDPDQPIITGRVYNAKSMPPFKLPDDSSVMGMRSNTLKGKGYNELSMNDTAGAELLKMHAQFNAETTVGNDQTVSIGNNKAESIGVDSVAQIGANANESVGTNKVIDVGSNLVLKAGSSITLQCGASRISMTSGGVVTISGTLVTMAGAVSSNVVAPITTVTGAALLTTTGGLNLVTGGRVVVKGGKILLN